MRVNIFEIQAREEAAMKQIGMLLLVAVTLICSSLAFGEEEEQGTLAVGVHGIGGFWVYGQPMFRWRPSDNWAFDFTPVTYGNDGRSELSRSESDTYGLNIGIVKLVRKIGGVSAGWKTELGELLTVRYYF